MSILLNPVAKSPIYLIFEQASIISFVMRTLLQRTISASPIFFEVSSGFVIGIIFTSPSSSRADVEISPFMFTVYQSRTAIFKDYSSLPLSSSEESSFSGVLSSASFSSAAAPFSSDASSTASFSFFFLE